MKQINLFSNIKDFTASSASRIIDAGHNLWKLFTVNLAVGAVIPEKSLCISIGIKGISICYGSKFLSRIKILGFNNIASKNERNPDPENFALMVYLAVEEFKLNKVDITLSIPKAWTIIQTVEFPIAVKKEISSAVSFELDRLTPFSPENALYDFTILNEKDDKIYLLLYAAKADLVNRYIQALAGKDLPVKRLTTNLSGIATLLTNIDKKSDFIFVQKGKYAFEGGLITDGSPISGITGNSLDYETTGLESIEKEISTLIAAHSEHSKPLKIITDSYNDIDIIPEHKFAIPANNLRHMDIKLWSATKDQQDIKNIPFTAAGGMLESLQTKEQKPDLLCKGIHKESKTPLALTVFLLLLILAMGIFYFIMPFHIENKQLGEIDQQIMTIKDEAIKVEELKKEVELLDSEIAAIDNFKHNSPMFLPILKELTIILPAKAWLTRTKINETKIEIEGYADTATDILPKLEASSYFKNVEFASATTRDSRKNVDRFVIKMENGGDKGNNKEDVIK
ncbi:MAG: PilN domain-containing protein [Pseudomonadota bacterium]